MKIDSFVSGGMNIMSAGDREELIANVKDSKGAEAGLEKLSNNPVADEDSENVISEDMVKNAIKQANKTLALNDKYIERHVHEITHTVMYVIKDSKTNEIVREFPPEKIQDMLAKMWELAGLFVDERR